MFALCASVDKNKTRSNDETVKTVPYTVYPPGPGTVPEDAEAARLAGGAGGGDPAGLDSLPRGRHGDRHPRSHGRGPGGSRRPHNVGAGGERRSLCVSLLLTPIALTTVCVLFLLVTSIDRATRLTSVCVCFFFMMIASTALAG